MSFLSQTKSTNIKVRTAVYMLMVPVLVFYVLAAVGCVSNSAGVPNIFNFSYRDLRVKPSKVSGKMFEIRTGYFGLCAGIAPEIACVTSLGSNTDQVVRRISPTVNSTRSSTLTTPNVKALLNIALENQRRTISWVIILAGFIFLLGLFSVLLLQWNVKNVQQNPNAGRKIMILKRMMLCFLWASTALAFGAALTASQLARTLQHTSHSPSNMITDSLIVEAGAGFQVLQWLAALFSFFFSVGISSISTGQAERRLDFKGPSSFDDVPEF